MNYKERCIDEFKKYLEKQPLEKAYKNFALEIFTAAFDYGSLNGASENIQDNIVKNINPEQNNVRDIIRQMKKFE